ncbi:transcriptional repressor NF-X1-like [Galendromus occidentalis]|uniref:Transcriptional repressor NF-X1-like n=1 Tax=Galendromus occidentalis TaxID=34638 RepID=A0AAJ7SEA6_9ACAR|nr:transcriptional repressor NF-X1-like [Galendromus occidentalis]
MSRPPADMGQSLGYQAYLSKYVLYFLRCPSKGRPKDCIHPCPRYVHSKPCDPCTQFVELECYCEATGIVKPCQEWCDMDESQKELIKCCRVRCAKLLECGHQCPQICHPGKCAEPKECVENVIRYCDCERIERIFPCRGCGAKDQEVQCDNICAELLQSYKQAIAEMKNNPFKHQDAIKDPTADDSSSCGQDVGVEAEELISSQKSPTLENKNESGSESGFNEDNKNSEDGHAESAVDVAFRGVEKPGTETECRSLVSTSSEVSAAYSAEKEQNSLTAQSDELNASSLTSEDSSRKPQSRVSRSSSRVSNYSEEDIPRQLDRDKIIKIMRSSTRRKKLIKCDQGEVINEMQNSS